MLDTLFAGPWGPLLIFVLRIVDVSLATVRMLLAMRNARLLVPLLGFVEVVVWIVAVGSAIQNLSSPLHVLGYAAGFATGNWVGLLIEGKLAMGLASIQIISRHDGGELAGALRNQGFGVTEMEGRGREGSVDVLLTVVRRRQVGSVITLVDRSDPDAFISIEEPRAIRRGWMFSKRRK